MVRQNEIGPRAAATAREPKFVSPVKQTRHNKLKSSATANAKFASRKRLRAFGPDGAFVVTGQTAKALAALIAAGKHGVTALEVNSWAYRLGAYVHQLRQQHGLNIETQRELHEGGWHGRYVLHSLVSLAGPQPDKTGGKQGRPDQPERRAA